MDNKIGAYIREQRKFKSLSQEDLAEKTGLSTMSVRRYENGTRMIPELALVRIAEALEVPVDYLRPDREPPEDSLGRGLDRMFLEYSVSEKYALEQSFQRIAMAFDSLNSAGREKAVERVEELTEIPRYQKEPQQPPQAPSSQDSETIPEDGKKPPEGC